MSQDSHMPVPEVRSFFDPVTFTASHVLIDSGSNRAAIIDPVLDFDPASGRSSQESAQKIVDFVRERRLEIDWILETHAHADHLTSAPWLKETLGGRIGIGSHIKDVQRTFAVIFNEGPDFATDGRQFDRLFEDGARFSVGNLVVEAMHIPGHTPACMGYRAGDCVFVGDTLFMPDYGTARCDFPGGDARTLYRSIRRILALPPETRLFLCHDYGPGGRPFRWETTVAAERADNIHVRDGISEDEFVAMRRERDRTLKMPRLMFPSIEVNMRAGHFPRPESNGVSYLKLPLNVL